MNVVLWIVQIVLALLSLAGGAYKVFSFDELAKVPTTASLPRGAWAVLGVFEMVCAVLLVIPAVTRWMRGLPPLAAAAALAVECVALATLYASYSLRVAVTNPLVWAVAMALMAAFVACGRYALRPPA